MQRNDFCECRSQRPSKFCLCVDPFVLLCDSCKLAHLQDQDKEAFHDLYPYEMIEVYERYGREGLNRRKSQLKAARNLVQLLKEREAEEYSRAVETLVEARHALDLVHRSIGELIGSTATLVQEALLTDVHLELEGFSSYLISHGNRPLPPSLFTPLYNYPSIQVLSNGFLRLTTESVEDLLVDLLIDHKTEPTTTRLKKTVTSKGLNKDPSSRSAYLTPRRTSKSKLSPYKQPMSHSKSSVKRKSAGTRDASQLNCTNLLIAAYDRDESIYTGEKEVMMEGYHSPSVLAKSSGKNSRIAKQTEDLLINSFEGASFLRKKNRSDVGVVKRGEEDRSPASHIDGVPRVGKKSMKLQKRLLKLHL